MLWISQTLDGATCVDISYTALPYCSKTQYSPVSISVHFQFGLFTKFDTFQKRDIFEDRKWENWKKLKILKTNLRSSNTRPSVITVWIIFSLTWTLCFPSKSRPIFVFNPVILSQTLSFRKTNPSICIVKSTIKQPAFARRLFWAK